MYVSMRRKTASVTSRARTTLSGSVVVEHTGHVRVCSMVTGGECLISAWNLCSIFLLPFPFRHNRSYVGVCQAKIVSQRVRTARI
jgi:hypothetical protein